MILIASLLNHLMLPLNVIDYLVIGPIKPSWNHTEFFWNLNYYNDVVFLSFFVYPNTKLDQTRVKKFLQSSYRTKANTILKIPLTLSLIRSRAQRHVQVRGLWTCEQVFELVRFCVLVRPHNFVPASVRVWDKKLKKYYVQVRVRLEGAVCLIGSID